MSAVDDLRHVSFRGVAAHGPLPSSTRRVAGASAGGSPHPAGPAGQFADWVLSQAKLDPRVYRSRVFARRLPSCLRILNVSSPAAARARLEERSELLPVVLSTLLIGVTGFFRDAPVFEDFRAVVLPRLIAHPWKPRVWSAACSSGAELYSIAILLDEAGLLDGATLLGTDCRDDAIAEARAATYGRPVTDTLSASGATRYFTPLEGQRVRAVARLRSAVSWKAADLHVKAEPGPWDVVLWRNAAIYIEPAAAERIYRQLAGTLVPGGFLVVGKAERPPFDIGLVQAGHCLYRKLGGPDVS